ncbi:MAG: hypothetical protein U7127_06565 [Phormidium sp.]
MSLGKIAIALQKRSSEKTKCVRVACQDCVSLFHFRRSLIGKKRVRSRSVPRLRIA